MDNSATSYPKPKEVIRAVKRAVESPLANPGRSSYPAAIAAAETLYGARESVARLVGCQPDKVVFTYNATYALNTVLKGVLSPGMRVAYEPFAHNSVLRVLYELEESGIGLKRLDASLFDDSVLLSSFRRLTQRGEADVLVVTHTSNVTGKALPLSELSDICRSCGCLMIVDASQGVGSSDIDMRAMEIDILASSGHKGLYGIMGTGFIAFGERNIPIHPLVTGGSGIRSLEREMPDELPERLEGGTVGLPGIISMKAGADYLVRVTPEAVREKERLLRTRLTEGLSVVSGVDLLNAQADSNSIVLFNIEGVAPEITSELLGRSGIAARSGYHCAPLIHELIGETREGYRGAVRLSVGYFNSVKECDRVLSVINKATKHMKAET